MMHIAGVQMDVKFADLPANLEAILEQMKATRSAGAELTVFPECALTGYCFEDREEALVSALEVSSAELAAIQKACRQLNLFTVVGFLEKDDGRLFNSVVCLGPSGQLGLYRKIHLPYIGADRFTSPGTKLSVIELPRIKLGMNICYDCSFPEASRVMMLDGADLIVFPTNWPSTSGLTADVIPNARALENHVYVMSVNRVGEERGFSFIGKSKICDPRGATLAFADHNQPAVITAEIDPEWPRKKHLVNIPGKHEIHRVNDRRPQLYGRLAQHNA